ncbi:MAG: LacI family DNA-binding transcriptional regulator [Firmicutes bacterium]|nr:LacI family DNA-binding transcriptional regulator [Bacillota bacterium]
MAASKKKSFREIARELHLSPATVSRIASGIGHFSPETTKQVTDALKEEGYILEEPSASLPVIAAVVTDLANELYNNILTCLTRYLSRKGILLQIYLENQSQETLLAQLISEKPEGIILLGTPLSRLVLDSSVPLIHVLSGSQASYHGKRYAIFSDEYVGGRLAARQFIENGCFLPVILNNRHTSQGDSLRIKGFLDEWAGAGKNTEDIYIHDGEPFKSAFFSAHDIIAYLKAKGQSFDAVFACSDWRAYGALVALREMNCLVPEEVKVIGFDGERVSRYCEKPFTTIQQNPDMIATAAMEMLLALIHQTPVKDELQLIPVQVQRGMSV